MLTDHAKLVATARLLVATECKHTVYAWQCWCGTCVTNILDEYSRNPAHLPVSVRNRVSAALQHISGGDPSPP